MIKQWIVLKPTSYMRVANASFKIKQGQVMPMPPFPIDPDVFDVFDDPKLAEETAAQNAELFNERTRHGLTTKDSLAKALARESKGPTAADRDTAAKRAKVITKEGLTDPAGDADRLRAELDAARAEIERLKATGGGELSGETAYLDQNAKTVKKRVRTAVKKGKLSKKHVESLISAEKAGLKRKSVLEGLMDLAKNDAIFGKLFK